MSNFLKYGVWATALGFCFFYLIYIAYFAVDFPIQDDLLFILLIDDFQNTGFSFGKIPYFLKELFRVDNDHCLMVPRVINLINYAIFKSLNFKGQILLVASFTLGFIYLCYRQFKIYQKPLWMFLPVVFFLLQPQYYEVSLWALAGLEHVGVILFLLAALISFQRDKITLGLIYASLGTFTSGNGIFIFGAIFLFLILERNYKKLIPAFAVFLGNVLLFILIYKKGQENNLAESLSHFPQLITYFFFLCGSFWEGLISNKIISVISGVGIVMLFIWLCISKLRNVKFAVSSLFLAVMAFNLVTLALVALGRFSVGQLETASRYQYYTIVLLSSAYLVVVSLNSSSVISKAILPVGLVLSLVFNIFSFYTYTETVAYNKLAYQADAENWRAEQNLFYIKPDFVNLVRPYFAATVEKGIWKPKSEFIELKAANRSISTEASFKIFEQNFQQDTAGVITESNNFILEVANLNSSPAFNQHWLVQLTNLQTTQRYILPIRFLANGKVNLLRGESYFRNFGYVKVFQGTLPAGNYAVDFLQKSVADNRVFASHYELKVSVNKVAVIEKY